MLAGLSLLLLAAAGAQAVSRARARAASPTASAAVARRIVSVARAELAKGVHEIPDGSNHAAAIRRYEAATAGAMYGAPWCAYFVSYVARVAGAPIGPSGSGMGYVPYIRAWARQTGRWTGTPRAGELITFPQHVGIVETVYSNHTLTTIEGNASNAVRRRWRRWSEAMGYVRLAASPSAPLAPAPAPTTPVSQGPVVQKLVARVHAYPATTIAPGQQIQFTSNDSSGSIVRSDWDLDGNGRFESHGDSVEHTYARAGSYLVRLRVTDAKGKIAAAQARITVRPDQAPVARLSLSSTSVTVGDTVTGDASCSSDPDGRIAHYSWDLDGDGNWGDDGPRHSVRFTAPGDYDPGLRVTDDAGNVSETHVHVHVADFPPPVARATCDKPVAATGETIHCTSDDSASPYRVTRHDWDSDGDGTDDLHGADVRFAYARAGDRVLRLRVTDAKGHTATTTMALRVTDRPPVARLSAPATAALGQATAFDASSSSDPDGTIVAYEWDLDGDGTYETTGARPAWTYAAPGTYAVRLRVTDDLGAQAVTTAILRVVDQAPVARVMLPASPQAGVTATFDATRSTDADGAISTYEWDLDGNGSYETTGARPAYRYAWAGTYTVRLRVTDAFGASGLTQATLVVR